MAKPLAEIIGDVTVVELHGGLDAGNFRQLEQRLGPLLRSTAKLVMDMTSLEFIDSAGIGAVLSVLKRLRKTGGDLKLCGASGPVEVALQVVHFDKVIDILADKDQAVRAFARWKPSPFGDGPQA